MSDEDRIATLEKRIEALEAVEKQRNEWRNNLQLSAFKPRNASQRNEPGAIKRNSRGEIR